MKTRHSIIAVVLTVSVLLSSFGIARVTHFCKMTSHPVQVEQCRTTGMHECCGNQKSPEGIRAESCCTTLIQLFKADLEPIVKAPLRVTSDQIAFVQLTSEPFSLALPVFEQTTKHPGIRWMPPRSSGLQVTLCTFLI